MDEQKNALIEQAGKAGVDSFMKTIGEFPDRFRLLQHYAPATFAGYGLIRDGVLQERPEGALDMKTKELMFIGLCTLHGDKVGTLPHAIAALKLGATLREIGEVMTQVFMVGGITTWNMVGYDVMKASEEYAKANGLE